MPVSVTTPEDLQPINGRLDLLETQVEPINSQIVNLALMDNALSTQIQNVNNSIAGLDARISVIESAVAALDARVTTLEAPVEPPPPPPPPPAPAELKLELVGGWRLTGEFARSQLAIDHATMRAFVVGHGQRNEVIEYALPARGAGSDYTRWPTVQPTRTIQGWWSGGYGNGIVFKDGQLHVAPRMFYDIHPPEVTTIYRQDGTTQVVNVPRQRFGGFVKGVNSLELGGGGYESGQGSAKGPTLAKMDGTILIDHQQNVTFEQACSREPNYWPHNGQDSWVCWAPRNGVGKWACDRVTGGGLRFSHGVYFWAYLGIGDLNYDRQNETFAAESRTYLFHYDPVTYQLKGWKQWAIKPELAVRGQEISPDGKFVYLTRDHAWSSGLYQADPVLEVYEVK